jgi:hypothetical protein
MQCDYQSLIEAAKCSGCIPTPVQVAVQNFLLAKIKGGERDPDALMSAARQSLCCVPDGMLPAIKNYLLCQIANLGGSGGDTPIPDPECIPDASAEAYFTAAGITDGWQQSAICQLVSDLKTYPAVGTKYWDREDVIYPMIGDFSTGAGFQVNLKNPGTSDFTAVGGITYSVLGVKGNGSTGYLNTNYTCPAGRRNNIRIMLYVDLGATVTLRYYLGVTDGGISTRLQSIIPVVGPLFRYELNQALGVLFPPNATAPPAADLGAWFIQRKIGTHAEATFASNNWLSSAANSLLVPNSRTYFLLARNNAGAVEAATYNNARISAFSVGDPLDVAGGNVEHLEYKGIWDTFQARFGRAHL